MAAAAHATAFLQTDCGFAVNNNLVQFTDQKPDLRYGATYLWDLGTGPLRYSLPSFINMPNPGTYQVCLTMRHWTERWGGFIFCLHCGWSPWRCRDRDDRT